MRTESPRITFASLLMLTTPLMAVPCAAQSAPSPNAELQTEKQPASWAVEVQEPLMQPAISDKTIPITLRPVMLAQNIEELAGQTVKLLNARVVQVFEPHALLIESVNQYLGERNRILVLIDAAKLRAPDDAIVASTVQVFGVAHTLLGIQVSGEISWPAELDGNRLRRLEVRAAVVAASVRTAEGTELTDRPLNSQVPRP
jgi:hypothetical protein